MPLQRATRLARNSVKMQEKPDDETSFNFVGGIRRVLVFFATPARADGGAGPEAMTMGNMCMVMFGYDMIHITAYLPGKSRSEYCEEIPATAEGHHGLRH